MDHIASTLKHPQLADLQAGTDRMAVAQKIIHQVLPTPLRHHIRIIAVYPDRITLGANHATWLTQARYHGPKLLTRFQQNPQLATVNHLRYRVHYEADNDKTLST